MTQGFDDDFDVNDDGVDHDDADGDDDDADGNIDEPPLSEAELCHCCQ